MAFSGDEIIVGWALRDRQVSTLTLKEDTGIFTQWPEEKKAMLKEKISVTRLGNTLDVVRAFEYLLDSPFVTGVTLDVNGGAFMI